MTKISRILTLALVIVLLTASMAFVAGSAKDLPDYENADVFLSTTAYEKLTSTNAHEVLSSFVTAGGNFTTSNVYDSTGQQNVDLYVVGSPDGDHAPYIMLLPNEDAAESGAVDQHIQLLVNLSKSTTTVTYDSTNPQYWVVEFDMTTESSFLPLSYSFRPALNGSSRDVGAWNPVSSKSDFYDVMTPGVFNHVTVIGDLNNNVSYFYVNDTLIETYTYSDTVGGVFNAAGYKEFTDGSAMTLTYFNIQIQTYNSLINANQSVCLTNLNSSLISASDDAVLNEYAGTESLSSWTRDAYDPTTEAMELPTLAKVNGTEYTNLADIQTAIDASSTGNTVSVMRDMYSGTLSINTEATVNTSELYFPIEAGDNVILTNPSVGKWVTTYKAAEVVDSFEPSSTVVESNPSNITNSGVISDDPDNLIVKITQEGLTKTYNGTTYDGPNGDIMLDSTGNKYLYTYDDDPADLPESSNASHYFVYALTGSSVDTYLTLDQVKYVIYDMDVYSEGQYITFYNNFDTVKITTDSNGTSKATTLWQEKMYTYDIALETGKWNHISFVGDVSTGHAYIYVNNVKVKTVTNGFFSASSSSFTPPTNSDGSLDYSSMAIRSFRAIEISGNFANAGKGDSLTPEMSIASDNHCLKIVEAGGEDISLSSSTLSWSGLVYGDDYEFPNVPPIATVNGVPCYDITQLQAALITDYTNVDSDLSVKDVVILASFKAPITVSGRARITTNGLEIGTVTADDGFTIAEGSDGIIDIYPDESTTLLAKLGDTVFYIGDEAALEAALALYSYEPHDVTFLSVPSAVINISNHAVIDTNGFDIGSLISIGSGCTLITDGSIVTVDAPFMPNSETETGVYTEIYNGIKYGSQDNLFSSVSGSIQSGKQIWLTLDNSTGKYYMTDVTRSTSEYVEMFMSEKNFVYTENIGQYIVFDFDIALEDVNKEYRYELNNRNASGSGIGVWGTSLSTPLRLAGIESGEFAHMTLVGNPNYTEYGGSVDIYVNGVWVQRLENGMYNATSYTAGLYYQSFRFGPSSSATAMIGGFSVRLITDESLSIDLTRNSSNNYTLTSENFSSSSYNIYSDKYVLPNYGAIALIDGVEYFSISDMEAVLVGTDVKNIEFLHVPTEPVSVNCPALVETHYLADASELVAPMSVYTTYKNESGSIVSVAEASGNTTVSVTVTLPDESSVTVFTELLSIGADIQEALTDAGILCDTVIAANGKVFINVVWDDGTPSGAATVAPMTFSCTAELSTAAYIGINKNGAVTEIDSADDALNYYLYYHASYNGSSADSTFYLILNSDIVIKRDTVSDTSLKSLGITNVYLNGYTMSWDASSGADRIFLFNSTNQAQYNFYGSGTMDFSTFVSASSNAIFSGTGYAYNCTATLKNIDIKAGHTLGYLYSGHLVFENCNIDCYVSAGYHIGMFRIGEPSTNFVNPVSLSLIDSKVNYRFNEIVDYYVSGGTGAPIIAVGFYNNASAENGETRIYIDGCEIVGKSSLISTHAISNPNMSYADLKVYINNSKIHVSELSKVSLDKGTIVFYDDVMCNISDISGVGKVVGLIGANTDNSMYPILYTSTNYSTVVWSDGTVEYWAAGSVPTRGACPFDSVASIAGDGGVKPGETYELEATITSTPSFGFYCNITLADYIGFNVYIPTSQSVKAVYMDGIATESVGEFNILNIGSCYCYMVKLAPQDSLRTISVVIELTDGSVLTRNTSIVDYANKLLDSTSGAPTEKNKALLSVMFSYIQQAVMYTGYTVDMTDVDTIFAQVGKTSLTVSGTEYDTTSLQEYFTGAQIDVRDTCTFRFNINKDDSGNYKDASLFSFTVGGSEAQYSANGTYILLSLRAFDMNKDIEISYDGAVIGTYNLYTYYTKLVALQGSDTSTALEAKQAVKLINTLWTYSEIAKKYR